MLDTNTINLEQIAERYGSLPKPLDALVNDPAHIATIRGICAARGITSYEGVLAIQQVATLVILGFVRIAEFAAELNRLAELGNPALADQIAKDIDAAIFARARDAIEKNYLPDEIKAPAKPAGTATPPGAGPMAGPLMFKTASEFAPVKPAAPIRIVPPAPSAGTGQAKPPAPPAAKVQIGSAPSPAPAPASAKTPSSAPAAPTEQPRIVHYGALKSILEPKPIAPSAPGRSAPIPLGAIGRATPKPVPTPPAPTPPPLPGVQGIPPRPQTPPPKPPTP